MAWTAPRTWVTAEVVSASLMNTHVRDNLLETAPATVANEGEYVVSDGANSITTRIAKTNSVGTSETTSSTSYTDLSTAGPAVSPVASDLCWVSITARMESNTTGKNAFMSFAISGATTLGASDGFSLSYESGAADDGMQSTFSFLITGLTSGSNTFTAKYRTETSNTATFSRRRINVIPF